MMYRRAPRHKLEGARPKPRPPGVLHKSPKPKVSGTCSRIGKRHAGGPAPEVRDVQHLNKKAAACNLVLELRDSKALSALAPSIPQIHDRHARVPTRDSHLQLSPATRLPHFAGRTVVPCIGLRSAPEPEHARPARMAGKDTANISFEGTPNGGEGKEVIRRGRWSSTATVTDTRTATDFLGLTAACFEWAESYDSKDWERLRRCIAPELRVSAAVPELHALPLSSPYFTQLPYFTRHALT